MEPLETVACNLPMELRHAVSDSRVHVGVGTYATRNPMFLLYHPDDRIKIGNYCSIAGEVRLLGGGEHHLDCTTTYPLHHWFGEDVSLDVRRKGPTVIGSDVWIGHGATILSGLVIGHGSVIGAGAVVASSLEPYSIAVGNPARCVRKRFDDEIVTKLLEIRWWDWDPRLVYSYRRLLFSHPSDLLRCWEEIRSKESNALYDDGKGQNRLVPLPARAAKRSRGNTVKWVTRLFVPPVVVSGLRWMGHKLFGP